MLISIRKVLVALLFCAVLPAAPARAAQAGFSFAFFCDSRGPDNGVNSKVLAPLVEHLVEKNPQVKFVVFPGDMVKGTKKDAAILDRQLRRWKEVMAPVYRSRNIAWPKVWAVPGNHEMQAAATGGEVEVYKKHFPDVFHNGPDDEKGLAYSFDFENAHFAMVQTSRIDEGDSLTHADDKEDWHRVRNLGWLDRDLAEARERGADHLFVVGHEAAFGVTEGHLASSMSNIGWKPWRKKRSEYMKERDRFWGLLGKRGVDAYLCGDEHAYARQKVGGVFQIVAGTAGAPLYGLNPCRKKDTRLPRVPNKLPYAVAKGLYDVLGYAHGDGDNCQAAPDFLGGSIFGYMVITVKGKKATAVMWGVPFHKKGFKPSDLKVMDEFVIAG